MKIVMIRHLKTPVNEKRQYIGRTDESLSERAVQQFKKQLYCEKKEVRFGKEPEGCVDKSESGSNSFKSYPQVERVVASPMKRCIQTAKLIYPGKKVQTEELLRECDFGLFEGKTYEDLKENPDYITWLESGGTIAFPEGEEQKEFRSRCVQGMKQQIDCLLTEDVESAAFVVHGGTIMAVLEEMAESVDGVKQEFYHWQVENGGGYQFEVRENEWKNGTHVFHEIMKRY